MTKCKDCRFWKNAEGQPPFYFEEPTGEGKDYGQCPLFLTYSGQPEDNETMAYAIDREIYAASVMTAPDFGCSQGEPKDKPGNPSSEPMQAVISATPDQLAAIRELLDSPPELCFIAENGVAVYEDAGHSILTALWKHEQRDPDTQPDWDELPHEVRRSLLVMAAESPQWHHGGTLDEYRISELKEAYPQLAG